MCGLCGFVTQKNARLNADQIMQRANTLSSLLLANRERGTHSTGLGLIKPDKKPSLLKMAVDPEIFTLNKTVDQALHGKHNQIILGHTRYATTGARTDKNAHPFIEGNIIGTHNGVISNYYNLDHDVDVDSQAVFRTLNKFKNDYKKALGKVQGSCTLVWQDTTEPDALYMVAHTNPLHVAYQPDLATYFYSSEYGHLNQSMRAGYGTKYEIYQIEPDIVHKLNTATLEWEREEVKFLPDYESKRYGHNYSYSTTKSTTTTTPKNYDDLTDEEEREMMEYNAGFGAYGGGYEPNLSDYSSSMKYSDADKEFWLEMLTRGLTTGCDYCGDPIDRFAYFNSEQDLMACQTCVDQEEMDDAYLFDEMDFNKIPAEVITYDDDGLIEAEQSAPATPKKNTEGQIDVREIVAQIEAESNKKAVVAKK